MSDKYKTYTCSYNFDGARWHIDIKAFNYDEARVRLAMIGQYGKVDGEVIVTFPVKGSWAHVLAGMRATVREFLQKCQP